MDIKANGYPSFWLNIRRGFNKDRINPNLVCPMNQLMNIKVRNNSTRATIPIKKFFVNYKQGKRFRAGKRIESWIQKYAIRLLDYNVNNNDENMADYLLLRNDFEEMINDIRKLNMPHDKCLSVYSWLLDRAFILTPHLENRDRKSIGDRRIKSYLNKNRSILLKTLYDANPKCLLECFGNDVKP